MASYGNIQTPDMARMTTAAQLLNGAICLVDLFVEREFPAPDGLIFCEKKESIQRRVDGRRNRKGKLSFLLPKLLGAGILPHMVIKLE